MLKTLRYFIDKIRYSLSWHYQYTAYYLPAPDTTIIVKYQPETVVSLSEDGLYYTDKSGEIRYIDFRICQENWKLARAVLSQQIVVADRDSVSKPIYIHFYDNPPVRFEFYWWLPFSRQKALDQYLDFRNKLSDVGWQTYDLT